MVNTVVVGAGIIGLSTAYLLKCNNPDFKVTIIADKFTPSTCSDGAAGIWKFSESGMRDTHTDMLRQLATGTLQWYEELLKREDAPLLGISRCSGYELFTHSNPKVQLWHKLISDCRRLTEDELKRFPENVKGGFFGTMFVCESTMYLPWLMERFLEKGGEVLTQKIQSFEELSHYEIVVNCAGLGAKVLCNDKRMEAMKGQVVRVKAPWINHFYFFHGASSSTYILPNINSVVLGGTYQLGEYNTVPNETTRQQIFKDTAKFVPSLKHAEFVRDWVGLRPSRDIIRLEKEDFILPSVSREKKKKILKVVHNYGHGPSGITMHWGSAQHAVRLVQECIKELHYGETVTAKL